MTHFTKSFTVTLFFLMITSLAEAQHYRQGQFIVDAFYGFPNFYSRNQYSNFNGQYQNINIRGHVSFTGIGPIGGRAEYMITDNLGFGIDFSYANSAVTISNNGYYYKFSNERLRILPRLNLHIGDNYKLDPYIAIGFGYYSSINKFDSNDKSYTPNPSVTEPDLYPLSIRAAAGCRYFFNDHIGAGVEIGLFGPLLTGGLTGKF
jgi:hypothetical protein